MAWSQGVIIKINRKRKHQIKRQQVDTITNKEVVNDTPKRNPRTQDREVTQKKKRAILNENIQDKTKEPRKSLPKLVLITTTQACGCVLERCVKGEKIVNKLVHQFSKKLTFEKLDHARERDLVTQLSKEYKLHYLPALLFFDEEGVFNKKMEGFFDKEEIEIKLKEIGGE